jgi:4'-phosphopantetheinyl transferase
MFSRTVDVVVGDLAAVDVDEDILSVAELGRALSIASTKYLRQYLAAHTWLRHRLAEYLRVPPEDIEFAAGEHGKPEIVFPVTDLSFNLSYSNGRAVLAAGFRLDVGVDIETLDGAKINPDMLHRVLSRPEVSSVKQAPDMVRQFLNLWVRKEAIAKATGWGVNEEPTATSVLGLSPLTRDGFDVIDVNLGGGFVAAVAVPEGCDIELKTLIEAAA